LCPRDLTTSQASVSPSSALTADVLAEAVGFALIMGCIGGLLPALSAIRLRVLDALR
jgi:ABC-type antimicrobial peptide transport system permease subunit